MTNENRKIMRERIQKMTGAHGSKKFKDPSIQKLKGTIKFGILFS